MISWAQNNPANFPPKFLQELPANKKLRKVTDELLVGRRENRFSLTRCRHFEKLEVGKLHGAQHRQQRFQMVVTLRASHCPMSSQSRPLWSHLSLAAGQDRATFQRTPWGGGKKRGVGKTSRRTPLPKVMLPLSS